MNANEEIRRLNKRLARIKGYDPVSQARRAELIRAIFALQQREG